MTCADGVTLSPDATSIHTKQLRIRNGRVVIGEFSGGYIQTSLDTTVKSRRERTSRNEIKSFWNKLKNKRRDRQRARKRGRLYNRILSGVQLAQYKNQHLRVMTLTSSPKSDILAVNQHFEILKKRIRRKFPEFEYCKIETPEGCGAVIHLLYRGCYIPQKWLSKQWNEIHSAPNVYLQYLRGNPKRVANYFLGYLGHHSEFRLGYSHNWVFRGFVREWTRIKRYFLRFFYFYGWEFKQAINAAVFHLKKVLYWIASDPFYSDNFRRWYYD